MAKHVRPIEDCAGGPDHQSRKAGRKNETPEHRLRRLSVVGEGFKR
jgi:hypothetical protein